MPAPGWKKKTKSASGVGLTLINLRNSAHKAHEDAENPAAKEVLESVLEVRDLDDVMEKAELAGRLFSANNPLPELLIDSEANRENLSPEEMMEQRQAEETLHRASLTVPRRPKWTPAMTAEELDIEERQAFLHWRRGLARLESNDKLVITPFEKNLDIWRQLWRVIERSDLIVLVVDSRNPLFYRCPDLEAYVRELDQNKKVIFLLNKADLLVASMRAQWARYLKSQGLSFVFWSAKVATEILEGKTGDLSKVSRHPSECIASEDEIQVLGRDELLDRLQREAESIVKLQNQGARAALSQHVEGGRLHANEEADYAEQGAVQETASSKTSRRAVVGFVGYPNVGKSSTINALVGQKKTGVTATPGKTKHFQTLIISEQLMLCDCPGLVFPSFSSSKSEMVASGVLPIDKLTDHRGPVQIVADSVPRPELERLYGISLPTPKLYDDQTRPPTAAELLFVFAVSRGYFANGGLPDETRAARIILKDYLSGKLPYSHLPPGSGDDVPSSSDGTECLADHVSFSEGFDRAEDVSHTEGFRDTKREEKAIASNSRTAQSLKEEIQLTTEGSLDDVESGVQDSDLPDPENLSEEYLARVFADLDSSGAADRENSAKGPKPRKPTHKMHMKTARKKDRTWRVGRNQSVVPPTVKGVKIPVSYGAADRHQVQVFE